MTMCRTYSSTILESLLSRNFGFDNLRVKTFNKNLKTNFGNKRAQLCITKWEAIHSLTHIMEEHSIGVWNKHSSHFSVFFSEYQKRKQDMTVKAQKNSRF